MESVDDILSHGLKPGCTKGLCRVHDVNEVVAHARHLLVARLGRANVHVFVNLHGISTDDLAAQGRGQGNCHLGFPNTRRAFNNDQRWFL